MDEPADVSPRTGGSGTMLYLGAAIGTIILLLLIGWLVLSAQAAERARADATAQEIHTLNVLNANNAILRAAQDIETGQRGYLLTGREEFLGPYDAGRKAMPGAIATLRTLTGSNPNLTIDLKRAEQLIAERLRHAELSLTMFRDGSFAGEAAIAHLRKGKIMMDGLRQVLADIERDERDTLATQRAAAAKAVARAEQWRSILLICTFILSIACAVAIFVAIKAWRLSRERHSLAQTNELISESRRLLQAVMDSSSDAIFVKDRKGDVLFANARFREITGMAPGEPAGGPLLPSNDPEEKSRLLEADRLAMETGEVQRVEHHIDFNGPKIFQIEKTPWLRDGQVAGIVEISREITDERMRQTEMEVQVVRRTAQLQQALDELHDQVTERQAAETALRQIQKLDSLGQLTGGIAHDFNNMLSIVIGSLAMARRRIPKGSDPKLTMAIDHAEEGASRAADLTARLLAFARQQPLDAEPVEVNPLLRRTAKLLERTLGGLIKLEVQLDATSGWAMIDGPQLENALVNLAVNARDAMPDGGTLTISASAEGDMMAIKVADTGEGMPPDVKDRVFEPFFTTKPVGKGTGLGLSQVHGFVTQSGGTIAIESRPGKGTAITLYIPAIMAPAVTPDEPATPIELPEAKATILLVEDEPLIRKATEDELRALGYRTLSAASGREALDMLEADHEVDLMLTDVAMPEMDGRTLAHQALLKRPELRILLTSGHDPDHDGASDLAMLPKPYMAADLASAIHATLNGADEGKARNQISQ